MRRDLLAFIFFAQLGLGAQGQAQDIAEQDFDERLKFLNQRYEGFFIHERDQKRWDLRRKSGIPELKAERERYEQERFLARKAFVRQPPKDMEPLRLQWESQQQLEKQRHEKARERFSSLQERLRTIEKKAKKIPENEELGLESDRDKK